MKGTTRVAVEASFACLVGIATVLRLSDPLEPPKQKRVEPSENATVISVQELAGEYLRNQIAADQRYAFRLVDVYGQASSPTTRGGHPFVDLSALDQREVVRCSFDLPDDLVTIV